ncbi:hypothetical protein [Thalassotalea hakodatensis]|uniref:hypothetical protein n=1 Tax=Thalassotalea hakodatensis TaxID=3030492 RepID=UPI0025730795|nr:hypothetical protein [Thalassotalea hakodatensis]
MVLILLYNTFNTQYNAFKSNENIQEKSDITPFRSELTNLERHLKVRNLNAVDYDSHYSNRFSEEKTLLSNALIDSFDRQTP